MYILGLSTMTESAAALMRDGKLVAAAEEERFSRLKHDGGFPYRAIQFVLESEGLSLGDVDHVAVYWNPYAISQRAGYVLKTMFVNPRLFLEKIRRAATVWKGETGDDSGWASLFQTGKKLSERLGAPPKQIHFLDHHECHMASCFLASDFRESAILVMDGAGEAACTTWGFGKGVALKKIDEHLLPHSLGHFYSAVTGYLGFKMLDGEYKLMGLSPYGDPSAAKWIHSHFLRKSAGGRYRLSNTVLDYHRGLKGNFDGEFANYFGPPREMSETAEFNDRHRDVAASAQRAFEEIVLEMASQLRKLTGCSSLSIAGGCGLNCVASGKILREGIFERIYVPPTPHDAGGALGAAMLLYAQLTGVRPEPITHAQYGPSFEDSEIEKAIVSSSGRVRSEKMSEETLLERSASLLAGGGILAWMQGSMEYGPRALGNRSILADPRNDAIRDSINEKIKKRELFRPFAPSVKAEKASDFFEIDQPSPFMTIVVPVRGSKRGIVPAIVHVDGTARPQTVEQQVNPRYWKLLDQFERVTGVPVLLNTSFNIQEPIVCSPEEALATFSRSGMDAMALGNHWVTHQAKEA